MILTFVSYLHILWNLNALFWQTWPEPVSIADVYLTTLTQPKWSSFPLHTHPCPATHTDRAWTQLEVSLLNVLYNEIVILNQEAKNHSGLAIKAAEIYRIPTYVLATDLGEEGELRGEIGQNSLMFLHTKPHMIIN